ncbi:MAG: Hsp20/alpha crystallin family protein [Kangiellaceae bacterium]|nr:Hsp20/alpha crystallin family protein [Kangiellaceae bacterium]
MNIAPWHSLRNFDDFFSNLNQSIAKRPAQEGMLSADWIPSVDIIENDDSFVIKAELPEVKKEDVKVSIDKNILTFSGERRTEVKDEKEHRIERSYGSFSRSFSLPDNIDDTKISAENKDGMLYLTIPKAEAKEKLTQIEIH